MNTMFYLFLVLALMTPRLRGQMSLAAITDLAMHHSTKAQLAKDDVDRAQFAVSEARDVFIPNVEVGGGLGRTYGITLNVPTIFTIGSQSLLYGPGQRDYIREARDGLRASTLAYQDVQQQLEEDSVLSCLAWVEVMSRRNVLGKRLQIADQLLDVTEKRQKAGLESELELKRSRRAQLQIQVQQAGLEDESKSLAAHLSSLTGMSIEQVRQIVIRVPDDIDVAPSAPEAEESLAVRSSEAYAAARSDHAHGDLRFLYRPRVLMQSQFGRISPINNVSSYYNLNGHYNVSEFAVALELPLFDRVRLARAHEASVDALHAQHQADLSLELQHEEDAHLSESEAAAARRLELAALDLDIARGQLAVVQKEAQTDSAQFTNGRQQNPKDELYAQMDEQQHYYDWLEARLQLQKIQVTRLRRSGGLDSWLARTASSKASPLRP